MENVKIDDEIIVDIKRLGINGEGIAYYLRKAVFIENAIPGETVLIKIIDDKSNYLVGKILKFIKTSSYRVKPFCKHYDECGGCQIQHIDYNFSKTLKRDLLMEAITKYSSLNPRTFQVNETIMMDSPKGYRNKSQMAVSNKDGLSLGLYKPNSRDIVNVEVCPVQNETINSINIKVLQVLESFDLNIKNIVTRVSTFDNKAQVTLVLNKDNKVATDAAKEIINIPNVISVYKSINTSDTSMFGEMYKLQGVDTITEIIDGFKFNLLPTSFFQLNSIQTQKLYQTVKKLCKLSFKENVIDAYCGVGTIATYLAKNAKKVIGIEINQDSITNAIENAKINKVKNVEFIQGDATVEIPNLIKDGFIPDVMVFDPPRTGLSSDIKSLISKVLPKRIVYVSCNPATLAKDLNDLKNNYNVKSITPFDMFPFTSHVESVTLLEKK